MNLIERLPIDPCPLLAARVRPAALAMRMRLCAADLVPGGLVCIEQGSTRRLWVVQSVTEGAGDGCVELSLIPRP